MDVRYLDFIVCPVCKGELKWNSNKNTLVCTRCNKEYPIVEDVPILLTEKEAQDVLSSLTDKQSD